MMDDLDTEILIYNWSFEDISIDLDFSEDENKNNLIYDYKKFDIPILKEYNDQLISLDKFEGIL